jgi:hypothetical protein
VVFIGTMLVADASTVRYQIQSVRAGSTEGFALGVLIDVRYGDDARYLEAGQTYIVGAGTDPLTGVLVSKVREPAPLFGGDAVIGVDQSDVVCPQFEDPVRTLTLAGTSVDSGLFTPLKRAKLSLLSAVLRPLGVAFAVLLGLVLLKHLMFAVGRSLRDIADPDDRPPRERRHRQPNASG